jgi:hypothetical protein
VDERGDDERRGLDEQKDSNPVPDVRLHPHLSRLGKSILRISHPLERAVDRGWVQTTRW